MTLPEGAELGATTDPKVLVKGEPGKVDANATRLTEESRRISGLAGDVDAIAIDGWEGGFGEPAYATARRAEQAKWRAYADLLGQAGGSLSTYAGALRTAQARAADAIAKWEEGETATENAVRDYNAAVEAYNAYVNRRVCVPTYGGPTTPSMGPARPGPFVDPGEALREEAQQILADARQALEDAGATAVKELGGLEGARTEGSTGPSAEGSVKGPSIDWGDWKDTFGKDYRRGADGKYEGGLKESPFAINLGEVEGNAKLWGAEGSWEDYWGDARVHADGSVTAGGVDAGASGRIDANGLVGHAHAGLTVIGVEGSAGGEWGYAEGEVKAEGSIGAGAEGDLAIGRTGAHAGGELFAGAKGEVSAEGDIGGVGGEGKAEGWVGVGAAGDADFGFHDGKFEVGGSGGLALGIGGKVGGHITIDPVEVIDTGGDIVEGIGHLLP